MFKGGEALNETGEFSEEVMPQDVREFLRQPPTPTHVLYYVVTMKELIYGSLGAMAFVHED